MYVSICKQTLTNVIRILIRWIGTSFGQVAVCFVSIVTFARVGAQSQQILSHLPSRLVILSSFLASGADLIF